MKKVTRVDPSDFFCDFGVAKSNEKSAAEKLKDKGKKETAEKETRNVEEEDKGKGSKKERKEDSQRRDEKDSNEKRVLADINKEVAYHLSKVEYEWIGIRKVFWVYFTHQNLQTDSKPRTHC